MEGREREEKITGMKEEKKREKWKIKHKSGPFCYKGGFHCDSLRPRLRRIAGRYLVSNSSSSSLGWWKAHDEGAVPCLKSQGFLLSWIIKESIFSGPLPARLAAAGGAPLPFSVKQLLTPSLLRPCNSHLFQFKTDTVIILCRTSQKHFLLNAWTIWVAPGRLLASLIMHSCLSIGLDNWYLEASSEGRGWMFFHTS